MTINCEMIYTIAPYMAGINVTFSPPYIMTITVSGCDERILYAPTNYKVLSDN